MNNNTINENFKGFYSSLYKLKLPMNFNTDIFETSDCNNEIKAIFRDRQNRRIKKRHTETLFQKKGSRLR